MVAPVWALDASQRRMESLMTPQRRCGGLRRILARSRLLFTDGARLSHEPSGTHLP